MFEYNNETYTLESLQKGAEEQGLEFDAYLKGMMNLGMKEIKGESSQEDVTVKDENMASNSEDGSLVYEFRTEGNKGAWGKSTDGGVTFEVVDGGNIPGEWYKDPKFMKAYNNLGFKAGDFKKEPDSRGWFEQAMDAGAVNADLYDNADAIFDINNTEDARKLSNTELQAYIDLVNKSKTSAAEMEDLDKFSKSFQKHNDKGENWLMSTMNAVNDNGGVFGGGMKGFAQASVQSFRSMANEELLKESIVPTTVGVGAGSVIPVVGNITAGTTAFFTSMNYGLETINTFNTLLEEEIASNPEKYKEGFSPESIRIVMADDEARSRIKNKARKRGATIASVEGVTNMLGIKGSGVVLKTGKNATSTVGKLGVKTAAGTVATSTEVIGGGTGEYLGEKAIGRDASGLEIVLESMAMAPFTAAKDVTVATVEQAVNRPSYQVDGTKVSKQAVEDYVNGAETAEEIASLNVKIDNDDAFAKTIHDKIVNTQLESQVNERIEDPSDRKSMVELEKQRRQAELDAKKKGIQAVPGAKENLENIEIQMNEIVGKYTAIDGRAKDVRARKKKAQDVRTKLDEISTEAIRVAAAKNTATIKKQMEAVDKKTGRKGQVVEMNSEDIAESQAETTSLFEAEIEGYKQNLENIKDKKSTEYIDAKKDLDFFQQQLDGIKTADTQFGYIIDRTDGSYDIVLNKDKPMVGTAAHEFQHRILSRTLKNNQDVQDKAGKALTDYVTGKFGGVSSGFINRMSAYINPKTGEQVSEFGEEIITVMSESILDGSLKYNESLFTKVGDVIRQTLQRVGAIDIKFDTGRDIYNFIKDYNRSIKKDYVSKSIVEMAVKGAKGKLVEGKAKTDSTIKMSKDASDNVQRIYEDRGDAGAFDIIEAFKPITSKIVQRRSEAPNFDRELLTSEIEIGKRGILDLIREYNVDSGVPLAAYINKFLPARAIEASKRVLGEEFTTDITERVDVAAEEVTQQPTKPKKKKIVLADRLGVKGKVDKAIKEKLLELDVENLNFKTLKDQTPEITGEMFGISPKKLISGANITKKELQSAQMFINKNADVLISMLPEGATASGTATGVPQTLLKAFYTKTDRAKMAKTGTKAGLAIQVKNDIKKTDFLEVFGIINGKPDRTDRNTSARVLALANQTGKMMTNQAVREQLSENITEENAKSMLKLSDGKSAIMFSKSSAKENNMPNIVDYFGNKTEADVANILDQHASLTEEQFKEQFPSEHNNVKDYIEDMAQFVADGGQEAMQFTKEMKGTNFGNSELNNYLKTGYWNLSDAKFKQDKKAIKWFVSNAHDLANQILLPKNATNGNMRMIMGFFAGHYNIVGSDMAKVGSVLKQGIVDRLNEKSESVLSEETLNRWRNFDFENLKSSYASTFYTGLKKIYAANTLKEQKAIAKEYFTGKEGATQKDFYDLWNTTLEEWLHSSEVGSKEFNSKADYILKLKKANAAIGTTGERVMAPGGYVYLPGSIMDGKIKFEHLKSSSQQSKESALLVINNKFKEFGDLAAEDYTGIYGPLELFNAVDSATGKVNSSNIFRLAGNLEAAKNIYSIDNLNQSLYDDIVSTIGKNKIKFLKQTTSKSQAKELDKAIMFSRSVNPSKGITVLDFDDTLATTKSLVKFTTPDGKTGTLNAEQFASTYEDLQDQGYTFDFSDFNKVVKGKLAPLFNKAIKLQGKFGPENMFVLTARPPQAQKAIFDFLKANGLNIPLKNITGLGNSTAEAKALWIADKVGDGYNDFYFADDALQNVQAVKNMLDQFDVKSKVQQAKIKFSKDASGTFNDIIQETTGIESQKVFSEAQAKIRGQKSKYKSIIPPSAQDFGGLLYSFLGKGKKGEQDMAFFKKALIDPFARGINELNAARQASANDYENLLKQFPEVKKLLNKKIEGTDYTHDQAVRIYLWDKAGFEIPGLSKRDLNSVVDFVENNSKVQAFADTIGLISKKEDGYSAPGDYWLAENIKSDLLSDGSIGDARAEFLAEWQQNADLIFSSENLNKIEAIYGSNFREALQDVLYRMKTGRNRPAGGGRLMNIYTNWVNNSVGAIMFLNMRSALLQTISATNYINWSDNNPLKAAAAFANQKQYWSDFSYLFNSDYLKQRRSGNQRGINEAELSAAVAGAENKAKAAIAWLLKKGFLPTQIADSFAISSGGATFYRNRIKAYIKQGMSKVDAEQKAFLDFQETTEVAQQSARPDMISQQQASPLGKLILAFQNTPMQYARIMNKAARDIYNGRGDMKTHTSKIIYYGFVQSIIFGALQSALFASLDDEDEEKFDKKKERILNGMIDSVLSGIGYGGKAISTMKNTLTTFLDQRKRGFNADHTYTILQLLGFSPPIGSKLRKVYSSIQTDKFNKDVFKRRGFTLDNPIWSAVGNVVEGVTNVPLGRFSQKMLNIDNALDANNKWWQRIALVLGWNTWDLGIKDADIEGIKKEIKKEKKVKAKEKTRIKREEKKKEKEEANKAVIEENKKKSKKDGLCSAVSKGGKRCKKKAINNGMCTVHEKAEQNESGKKTQCTRIKSSGKRCGMKTSSKSGLCYYHD